MRAYMNAACNQIDAAVFNGDILWDEEDRGELKEYVERWLRAIEDHERMDEGAKK